MARADAGAGVAVEILVKRNQPGPERILLEALDLPEHCAAAPPVLEEDPAEPPRQLVGDGGEGHEPS